jgi:hypothetical protein
MTTSTARTRPSMLGASAASSGPSRNRCLRTVTFGHNVFQVSYELFPPVHDLGWYRSAENWWYNSPTGATPTTTRDVHDTNDCPNGGGGRRSARWGLHRDPG